MSRTKMAGVAVVTMVAGIVAALGSIGGRWSGDDGVRLGESSYEGGGYHVSRTWGGYTDLATLAAQAQLVVIATVESEAQLWLDDNIAITDATMIVAAALKGAVVEGDRIKVRQTGGRDSEGQLREVVDDPLMERGTQYLLFLWEGEDGLRYVWAGPEGRFVVSGDAIVALSDWYDDRPIRDTGISGISIGDVAAIVGQHPEVVEPDRSALSP